MIVVVNGDMGVAVADSIFTNVLVLVGYTHQPPPTHTVLENYQPNKGKGGIVIFFRICQKVSNCIEIVFRLELFSRLFSNHPRNYCLSFPSPPSLPLSRITLVLVNRNLKICPKSLPIALLGF